MLNYITNINEDIILICWRNIRTLLKLLEPSQKSIKVIIFPCSCQISQIRIINPGFLYYLSAGYLEDWNK